MSSAEFYTGCRVRISGSIVNKIPRYLGRTFEVLEVVGNVANTPLYLIRDMRNGVETTISANYLSNA
jgi:hypothetical protein